MDENLCRHIYLALRTAPASDITVRGIAALRRVMFDTFGEERQRELVAEWNALELPQVDVTAEPRSVRNLAKQGIGYQWIQAGMPQEMAQRLSHLFDTMFDHVYGMGEDDADLLAEIDERLARNPPDFSNARIIANKVLVRALYEGNVNDINECARCVREILVRWRDAEADWGRHYELEEVEWIIDHAADIALWSEQVRDWIAMIRDLDQ